MKTKNLMEGAMVWKKFHPDQRQKRGSWTYERHGILVLFSLCGFKRNMQRGCSDQTKLFPTNTKIASALDGAHKNPILAGYEMPSPHGVEQLQ